MDYSKRELADRLAAEYVLGTLRGAARRRFEALLPAHPTLNQARLDWERRLTQLSTVSTPVAPSRHVWDGIQQRLFGALNPATTAVSDAAQGVLRWWQRLGLWQGATAFATVAAMALAIVLALPTPPQPPIVVVMAAQPAATQDGVVSAAFVASVSGDGRSLVVKPLNPVQQVALDKALELWAVPAKGPARSLGLVSRSNTTTVQRAHLLDDTAAFAVTLEPPGGAPHGVATGPIISVGKIEPI